MHGVNEIPLFIYIFYINQPTADIIIRNEIVRIRNYSIFSELLKIMLPAIISAACD